MEHNIANILPLYKAGIDIGNLSYGKTQDFDIKIILGLMQSIKAESVFEFGTWYGHTSLILSKFSNKVYTIDLPIEFANLDEIDSIQHEELLPKSEIGMICKNQSNIKQFYGDSSDVNVIRQFRNYIGSSVDLCYIDANHRYEYVLCDSLSAMAMTKDRGIVIWHDVYNTLIDGVTKALNILPCNIYHIKNSMVGFMINDT